MIQPRSEEIFEMPFQIRPYQMIRTDEPEKIGGGSITSPEIMVQAEGYERRF